MQHQELTLKNNLKTLFVHAPGSTASTVQIWFRAGSSLETHDNEGIAHFLEHMFFKGTNTRPGAKIAHEVETFGGEINAFTSFDYTCYYTNIPNTEIIQGINTILEMVSKPLLNSTHIPSERKVVLEELKKTVDNPNQYSFCEIQKKFFSGGYAHPILGTNSTISTFSKKQLTTFRQKYYNLTNALLIISGDLSNKTKIIKEIEKFEIPAGPASSFPQFTLKNNAPISIHSKDVKMSQLNLIIQGPEFLDISSAAEDLAFTCLGHGEASRLYSQLVLESSLANNCVSSTMFLSKGSFHNIRIIFPHKNLQKILKKLESILSKLYRDGFENKEINRIKNQYASSKVFDKESLESYTFSLGHSFAQTGSIFSEQDFLDNIKKATPESVNTHIKKILSRKVNIQLQVPDKTDHDSAKQLLEIFRKKIHNIPKKLKTKKVLAKNSASKFDPQVQLVEIKKGIHLIYRQNLMTPTYVLHAYLKGGLIDETPQTNGIFNLMTQNLYKGYNKISYNDIKHILENSSSTLQGFSGKNAYGLTLHGLTEYFNESFEIFMGSLLTPDFPIESIDHEKEMTIRHIESQQKDPVKQCFQLVGKSIFNDHPYSYNNYGTKELIQSFSKKQLHDQHQQKIQNERILFSYCGNLDLDIIKDLIIKKTTGLKERTGCKYISKKYTPLKESTYHLPFEREQTQIFVGIPVKGINSIEGIILNILTTILSGQGSILFNRIREKQGLSYVVQPVHFSALDGGYWGIYMACGNENVKKALSTINGILDELKQKGMSEVVFKEAKKMIKGQTLLNIQTNEDYANIYSIPFIFNLGIDHFHLKNQQVEKLSYNMFTRELKKVFSKKRYTVTVGSH